MPSMKEIRARLRELGLENEFGYRKEIKSVPECLHRDESLLAITSGIREGKRWYILVTEGRVLILSKPPLGQLRLIGIERSAVQSVESKRGLFFATVTVATGEGTYTFTNVLKKSLPSFLSTLTEGPAQTD
jgi:hypothetical protein